MQKFDFSKRWLRRDGEDRSKKKRSGKMGKIPKYWCSIQKVKRRENKRKLSAPKSICNHKSREYAKTLIEILIFRLPPIYFKVSKVPSTFNYEHLMSTAVIFFF